MARVRVKTDAQTVALVRKQLKAIAPRLDKEFVAVLKDVGEIAARDARQRLAGDVATSPKRRPGRSTGRAAASIKVGVSGGRVHVRGGGTKATAYYGWLDYGGTLKATGTIRPSRVNTQQRTRVKTGRYIYPAIDAQRARVTREIRAATVRVVQQLGLDQ